MLLSTEMALSVPRGQVSTHELLAFLMGFLEMGELDRLSLSGFALSWVRHC